MAILASENAWIAQDFEIFQFQPTHLYSCVFSVLSYALWRVVSVYVDFLLFIAFELAFPRPGHLLAVCVIWARSAPSSSISLCNAPAVWICFRSRYFLRASSAHSALHVCSIGWYPAHGRCLRCFYFTFLYFGVHFSP